MRSLKITLVFLCILKMHFAQSIFVPLGSYYNYNFTSHDGGTTGIKTLYYTSDTIINTGSYKKICTAINYHCVCPNPPIYNSYCTEYLLERNDSLFQYFIGADTIQCLYTFNSNIGDSIVFDSNPTNPNFRYKIVLDSIGTKFICGQNRQTMYYSKFQDLCPSVSTTVTVVKGIGPIDDYLFSQTNQCELGIGFFYFNCVNTGNCNYPSITCVNEPLGIKKNTQNEMNMFVSNDVYGIYVRFPEPLNGSIVIRNILGVVVFRIEVSNKVLLNISTSNLSKGVYLISVDGDTKILTQKFIIE